jgi:hypothetical protein
MSQEILTMILSSLGGFAGAFAAMRTDITWLKNSIRKLDSRLTFLERKKIV